MYRSSLLSKNSLNSVPNIIMGYQNSVSNVMGTHNSIPSQGSVPVQSFLDKKDDQLFVGQHGQGRLLVEQHGEGRYGSSPQRQVKISENCRCCFSSTLVFAAAVKKVHLPLRVVPIGRPAACGTAPGRPTACGTEPGRPTACGTAPRREGQLLVEPHRGTGKANCLLNCTEKANC